MKSEFEEGVDLGSRSEHSILPNLVYKGGGVVLAFNVMQVNDIVSRFYTGHLPYQWKPSSMPILVVSCLESGHIQDKWLPDWFLSIEYLQYKLVGISQPHVASHFAHLGHKIQACHSLVDSTLDSEGW